MPDAPQMPPKLTLLPRKEQPSMLAPPIPRQLLVLYRQNMTPAVQQQPGQLTAQVRHYFC